MRIRMFKPSMDLYIKCYNIFPKICLDHQIGLFENLVSGQDTQDQGEFSEVLFIFQTVEADSSQNQRNWPLDQLCHLWAFLCLCRKVESIGLRLGGVQNFTEIGFSMPISRCFHLRHGFSFHIRERMVLLIKRRWAEFLGQHASVEH